jgi:hypothetical protein
LPTLNKKKEEEEEYNGSTLRKMESNLETIACTSAALS